MVRVLVSSGYCSKVVQTWQLKTTEIYFLIVLEAGNLSSKCWQGWLLLRAMREGLCQASLLSLWMAIFSLLCLPSLHVCVQLSSYYKDTSHIELGTTLIT